MWICIVFFMVVGLLVALGLKVTLPKIVLFLVVILCGGLVINLIREAIFSPESWSGLGFFVVVYLVFSLVLGIKSLQEEIGGYDLPMVE